MNNRIEEENRSEVKLPQRYALQLERLLAHGLAPSEILGLLQSGSEAELAECVTSEVNWERLLTYAKENWQTIEYAVLHGYSFPFITIGGIKSLLAIKFLKLEERDYRFTGHRVEGLQLNTPEYERLRGMVPLYWNFIRTDADPSSDNVEITIRLENSMPSSY
ncbi:hypothetical protein Back11_42900 [Paenibacillus baekrokdamisoli]|uniref:Uncharacterized protein n=1 Tax=Paenibacillus baekrokdamisoli TaxID=1712516 RepID=A0A3G9J3L5_9BACL|nr:hypothetical protein [Paenibacillus baekrokdamisoli]MBB3068007.1 hypothetical protein [Paenibacillus baekrokdamisoli]BBH22945.1 hypothetical protein Back11_42900 [Paenibacillus baekrokdamisoli]